MKNDLVINKVISVFEGEFKPGLIKRKDLRSCDGFCLYIKGKAEYIFKNKTLQVAAEDVLFLPEGGDYSILVIEECKYICIDFSFNEKGLSPKVIKKPPQIKNDFYKLFYNNHEKSQTKIPKSYEIINRIYCELINASNKKYSKSSELFGKAVKAIILNYRDASFSVESLASDLHLSTVHLRRLFSLHAGTSPIKYINSLRFEQAKILLTSSNLSVGEIAYSVGFSCQFHFSKAFKNAIGISPTEYRKISLS